MTAHNELLHFLASPLPETVTSDTLPHGPERGRWNAQAHTSANKNYPDPARDKTHTHTHIPTIFYRKIVQLKKYSSKRLSLECGLRSGYAQALGCCYP